MMGHGRAGGPMRGGGGPGGPGGGGRSPGGPGPGGMGMMLPAEKAKDFRGAARRLIAALGPERRLVIAVIVLAVASVAATLMGPRLLGEATNVIFRGAIGSMLGEMGLGNVPAAAVSAGLRAQGQDGMADMIETMQVVPGEGIDFGALAGILGLVSVLYLAGALLGWMQAWIMAGVTQRTVYRLRREVDEKLGRLPLATFDRGSRGDLLSRVTNDIDNINQSLQQVLTQLITALLTVIGVLGIMLLMSPLLALISILAVPLSVIVTMLIAKRSQSQFAVQWAETGRLNGHVEEQITGHLIVRLFGRQEAAIAEFDARNASLHDASRTAQFLSGLIQPAMTFISNLNYVAICVIGGVQVATGQLTLGQVQAFIQYSRQFTFPIMQVASMANVIQSGVASAERVFALLDEPEEVPDPVTPVVLPQPVRGRVAFERVSFRYLPEKPLIAGLDLLVEPGSRVAIVGPTGAGKTTLVNLLMRFYDVDEGRITLDGIDIRDLRRDDLRRAYGMVLQDAWLFSGTIAENIRYGARGEVSEAAFQAAVEAAHVDHFARTLPAGYETQLTDDATAISAGEKQLITIARAFLADPPILILDEATSSVDTRTEVLIQRAMRRLMEGRTAFVIAHRLSTIRDADRILVVREGSIVEQGTHAELLAAGGVYHGMYASQFADAADAA